jgi:hypothetical protein
MARNAPVVMASLEKNCFEHISLMSQEQVEVEMKNEMQQLQMIAQQMQQVGQQNPQMAQQMQIQARMISEKIESRKAVLIAEMMEEFMNEEKKITSQFDNDPLTALKSRELDLQAQENERKKKADQDQLNIDRMKAMMNQSTDQQKLQQNEELAKMRANTSIEKTILSAQLKNMAPKRCKYHHEKVQKRQIT